MNRDIINCTKSNYDKKYIVVCPIIKLKTDYLRLYNTLCYFHIGLIKVDFLYQTFA